MKMNKNTIALVSAFVIASNAHGMWSSITEYVSAAQPAVNTACSKAWSKIKENKGYIGAAATAAGLVYGGIKAYRYYTAPAVTAQAELAQAELDQAELDQAATLLDEATRSATITNMKQPVVAAELASKEKVIAAVVENQVDLQHSASANSLSSASTVEADLAVQAPIREHIVTTTHCGNTLKVVKNAETNLPEFCLVDQSGQLKNRDREILFIAATERAIAKDKHYVIEKNKTGQVTVKVTNIAGGTLERQENIFRD